eukprot:CCRYP_000413-RA/>CCRYP_000413-RA protein AED:0.47 eAED:0.46 QI:0/0/0/1/0/0/2/0/158
MVKTLHHAIFDEAWYLQLFRPPFAQMLHYVGPEVVPNKIPAPPARPPEHAIYPPLSMSPKLPPQASSAPLPLRVSSHQDSDRSATTDALLTGPTPTTKLPLNHKILQQHDITHQDMQMVYISSHPFHDSFEEDITIRLHDHNKHSTDGLVCIPNDERL